MPACSSPPGVRDPCEFNCGAAASLPLLLMHPWCGVDKARSRAEVRSLCAVSGDSSFEAMLSTHVTVADGTDTSGGARAFCEPADIAAAMF